MTIRRTLLVFFLFMSLAPAALVTVLAFYQAREALKVEIMRNLDEEAAALMEQIDRMLFERLQNVHTWSHLEIMQEVRVRDVDKRLSHFLFDLKKHYEGVYTALYCSDLAGEVVAASDPALVGGAAGDRPLWLAAGSTYGETLLEPLSLDVSGERAVLPIRAAIHGTAAEGDVGQLHVLFDWNEIFRLLDKPPGGNGGPKLVLVFDREGRIVAASMPVRQRGLLLSDRLASWMSGGHGAGMIADRDNALGVGAVLAGVAHSSGYQHFTGLGWSVLMAEPAAQAFLPIQHMALAFLLLLVATSAAAVGVSLLISNRIARPIVRLTDFTRYFMQERRTGPPIRAGGEVGELAAAFQRMIEDLEKSRENLVRAAKLAVVGEMAAAMAHEVRTPLGILRSSVQMLQREPTLTGTGREMLGFVLAETDRLNRLVSVLLDCARPRPPCFRPHRLHEIIQRVLELLAMQARHRNIRIEKECGAVSDLVFCDEEQIVQVLLNLLMNALQILPGGGEIVVRTRKAGDQLVLEVEDDGPGIPADYRTRVFDPFFTQREGGIGLGLTVAQQIVRAHGATLVAEASPQGGARFRIGFPDSPPNPTETTHP